MASGHIKEKLKLHNKVMRSLFGANNYLNEQEKRYLLSSFMRIAHNADSKLMKSKNIQNAFEAVSNVRMLTDLILTDILSDDNIDIYIDLDNDDLDIKCIYQTTKEFPNAFGVSKIHSEIAMVFPTTVNQFWDLMRPNSQRINVIHEDWDDGYNDTIEYALDISKCRKLFIEFLRDVEQISNAN